MLIVCLPGEGAHAADAGRVRRRTPGCRPTTRTCPCRRSAAARDAYFCTACAIVTSLPAASVISQPAAPAERGRHAAFDGQHVAASRVGRVERGHGGRPRSRRQVRVVDEIDRVDQEIRGRRRRLRRDPVQERDRTAGAARSLQPQHGWPVRVGEGLPERQEIGRREAESRRGHAAVLQEVAARRVHTGSLLLRARNEGDTPARARAGAHVNRMVSSGVPRDGRTGDRSGPRRSGAALRLDSATLGPAGQPWTTGPELDGSRVNKTWGCRRSSGRIVVRTGGPETGQVQRSTV